MFETPLRLKIDTLIVGQGLAGSILAWKLLERGQRILVVDRDEAVTSSKVAAGLLTPITGTGFSIPGDLSTRLNFAKQFYWDAEEKTGQRFFHHTRIARIFRNAAEKAKFDARKSADPANWEIYAEHLNIDTAKFNAPHSGIEMKEGGWLNVPLFLESTRQHLLERAAYAIASVDSRDVLAGSEIGAAHGVRWKRVEADRVIFAQGWEGNQNRFFDWVPMNPAAGDILDLDVPELEEEERIINRGGWLLPIGSGRFRAGSTYRHDFAETIPNADGRIEVLEKLDEITSCKFRVISHKVGIRPIIHRSKVFFGKHHSFPEVSFFNGLGSKGVLNGPWHAERMVAHLLDDENIPEQCDLNVLPH